MPTPLFTPGHYVPLSPYTEVDPTRDTQTIGVQRDIADYIVRHSGAFKAARLHDGVMSAEDIVAFDAEKAEVQVHSGEGGTVVLISELFLNTFPVSTHWDASMNEGRGGARVGASDALGELTLHPDTGEIGSALDIGDANAASPYLFDTARYALLSRDRNGRAPSFERYIGDVYSLHGVPAEVALRLSDDCLKATGYPVLFRNASDADRRPQEGLPVYQLVNNQVIRDAEGAGSLVSLILPPGWTRERPGGYSCLFTGYYDQNENVYRHCGLPMMKSIAAAMDRTGRGVVGIIWNGGGSVGTRTQHPSALGQLNLIVRMAAEQYGVDPHAIVTVGGSRGGLTALLAACNPIAEGYTVRYAVCYGVPFSIYGPGEHLLNVTYPARWSAVCSDIGYKHSWRPGWRDEEGRSASERYWQNTFGTTDEARIARELHPQSDRMLGALRERGTQVWLNSGTHDPFTAFWPTLEWVSKARAYGIPVRHEIGYRHGHNNCTDLYESAVSCLEALVFGAGVELNITAHYRRSGEGAEGWTRTERFEPAVQPVFFEGPKRAVAGLPAALAVYGAPGMAYRVAIRRQASSDDGDDSKPYELVLMEGVLPVVNGVTCSYASTTWIVPEELGGGAFEYALSFRRGADEGEWQEVAPEGVPHPGTGASRAAELVVLETAPNFIEPAWLGATMVHFIGWGLSEA